MTSFFSTFVPHHFLQKKVSECPPPPKVWSLETLTLIKTLEGHTDAVRALVAVNNRVFSGSYDGTIKVWDLQTLEQITTMKVREKRMRENLTTIFFAVLDPIFSFSYVRRRYLKCYI